MRVIYSFASRPASTPTQTRSLFPAVETDPKHRAVWVNRTARANIGLMHSLEIEHEKTVQLMAANQDRLDKLLGKVDQ